MYTDPNSRKNLFHIAVQAGKVPFSASRHHWTDHDLVVVTHLVSRGKYGQAFGFPVRDGVPNEHFDYASCWTKRMEIPNAGSFQWRLIAVSDSRLAELIIEFYSEVGPKFGFAALSDSTEKG